MNSSETFDFCVRSYECGPDGLATLPTICNYLQEAASLNAATMAFSKSDFEAEGQNLSWVLTRLRVHLNRYPRWRETVHVTTWPSGGRRIAATRDFELRDDAGALLGVATSEWMIIDLAERKVHPIPQAILDKADTTHAPVLGEAPFPRLKWTCSQVSGAQEFRAGRGEIDLNGHVNNVHYVRWLLDTLPSEVLPATDLSIVFRTETRVGETLFAESVEVEPGVHIHRLSAPDGTDHILARTTHAPING